MIPNPDEGKERGGGCMEWGARRQPTIQVEGPSIFQSKDEPQIVRGRAVEKEE
jgi:hypothetical protein